jgi:hypothetical protein
LLVDPDAVLALPVTRQGFEAVARKLRQVAEAGGRFKEPEPLFGLTAVQVLETGMVDRDPCPPLPGR